MGVLGARCHAQAGALHVGCGQGEAHIAGGSGTVTVWNRVLIGSVAVVGAKIRADGKARRGLVVPATVEVERLTLRVVRVQLLEDGLDHSATPRLGDLAAGVGKAARMNLRGGHGAGGQSNDGTR